MSADNNFYTKKPITKTINNKEVNVNVYTIDINTPLYRGDNKLSGLDDENILKQFYEGNEGNHFEVKYKFFTPDETAAEQYGVVYEFKTKTNLEVVALDDITEEFYNDAPEDIQDILKKNYGYNNNKLRDSDVKADSKLIDYLCKNHFDGYATNFMNIGGIGGSFHKEVALCNPETVVEATRQITNEKEAIEMRKEARYKSITGVQRKKKPEISDKYILQGLSGTKLFGGGSDSDDDQSVKRLFGGKKRKSNKRKNTKKRAKSNKRRNTKKRAKSTKRRNTKK
jgi:hypothetical protein